MNLRSPVLQSFSIIIPTRNRLRHLYNCLSSLAHFHYPLGHYEVIVVDDNSDVPAENVTKLFRKIYDIRCVRTKHGGPAAARNTGVGLATNSIIAFLDDDCTADSEWLNALNNVFKKEPEAAVGGKTYNAITNNIYAVASQAVLDATHANSNNSPSKSGFFASLNVAYPAKGFRAIGGFDPSFPYAEDRDLCDRWRESGRNILYAPEAVVYHHREMNFSGLCKQHFHYGRGAFYLHRARISRGSEGVSPSVGFYTALMSALCHYGRSNNTFALGLLLAVTQAAYALGMATETAFEQRR